MTLSGFAGEVHRHYATRSDVQDIVDPVKESINKHLGFHEGFRFTLALVVPLVCVAVSATAILIAALIR